MARRVQDLPGIFKTTENPRLSQWDLQPDTCEGPVCFAAVEDGVAA